MGDGFADRYARGSFFTSRLIDATPDRGFRRSIFVVQRGMRQELVMPSHEFKGQALAGSNDDTKRVQLSTQRLTKHGMVQRRDPHDVRDVMVLDERRKLCGVAMSGL